MEHGGNGPAKSERPIICPQFTVFIAVSTLPLVQSTYGHLCTRATLSLFWLRSPLYRYRLQCQHHDGRDATLRNICMILGGIFRDLAIVFSIAFCEYFILHGAFTRTCQSSIIKMMRSRPKSTILYWPLCRWYQ